MGRGGRILEISFAKGEWGGEQGVLVSSGGREKAGRPKKLITLFN